MSINKDFGVVVQALKLFSTGPAAGSKQIADNALHCLGHLNEIIIRHVKDCPMCNGDGGKVLLMPVTVVWQECDKCEGRGYVPSMDFMH